MYVVAGEAVLLAVLVDVFARVDEKTVADHKRSRVTRPGIREDRVARGFQGGAGIIFGVSSRKCGREESKSRDGSCEEESFSVHVQPSGL